MNAPAQTAPVEMAGVNGPLQIWRLGRVEYQDGLELQRRFGEALAKGEGPNVLLLLEHSPVLTLGRAAKKENVVAPPALLAHLGAEVVETSRGGDVTYHGPGQLVAYPIFQLREGRRDVRRFVRDIEETVIRTVADFGLKAGRISKWPGVWMGEEGSASARKIGAIGVHLSRWQSSHGLALNVNTDLSHFQLIVPCGIKEADVTSMQRELGRPVEMAQVEESLARHFAQIFHSDPVRKSPSLKTVSVALVRRTPEGPSVLLLRRTKARGGFEQLVTGKVEPGETPQQAAARELQEETGQKLPVQPLDYVHSFAFGEGLVPQVVEETSFMALTESAEVRLDPQEHTESEWVGLEQALTRLPYAGLRVATKRALGSLL